MTNGRTLRPEPDALDLVLLAEETLEPSPDFEGRVMATVRQEAAAPAPILFPWHVFGLATIVSGALCVWAAWGIDPASVPDASAVALWIERAAHSTVALGLCVAAASVTGSLALAWVMASMARPSSPRLI